MPDGASTARTTSGPGSEGRHVLQDLKKFLMRGNVVDLAVAVVIGAAFNAVVQALVNFIINPLIAGIFGEPDITDVWNFTLRDSADPEVEDTVLSLGGFLQEVLNFLIIGTALFIVVKAFEALQERRANQEVPAEETPTPSDEAMLLSEIRDLLKAQQQ
jgi:large conductance mechanosensitive channel